MYDVITHKYRESQQFSRVEYSTQICWYDTRGAKEYSQVLATGLSIQPHMKDLISATKYLVESNMEVMVTVAQVTVAVF